eukprot:TRINITY_DN4392_c0_g1_i1.p1 TRINITY_DN4392_c0_g1~~TRINITY_DN4392_c0_g1_i1.p1  ORF type:complete len:87 (+),score=10.16 TRINITY_DN4392_c0_g1_i1:97-357(+)
MEVEERKIPHSIESDVTERVEQLLRECRDLYESEWLPEAYKVLLTIEELIADASSEVIKESNKWCSEKSVHFYQINLRWHCSVHIW